MSVRELAPYEGVISAVWTPRNVQTGHDSTSGAVTVLEIGTPYWEIEYEIDCIDRETFDKWKMFLLRRQGRAITFITWPILRPRPRDESVTSDAGIDLDSISEANSTITVSGLAASQPIAKGDFFSYRTAANGYWIGTATEAATADGSGDATITVWPRPRAAHATVRELTRIRPVGEFRLIGEPRMPEEVGNYSIRFSARQVIV
ncbi:hypothetical protein [Ponticaulis profundi]|uniref:Uncharacterized protein n=1 Tax=Ponticaulis profundi TaxID=2665222 RepID=A0ABW1S8P3_9PROT